MCTSINNVCVHEHIKPGLCYANCTGRVLAHTAGLISCVPQSVVAIPESFSYFLMMHFFSYQLATMHTVDYKLLMKPGAQLNATRPSPLGSGNEIMFQ